MTPTPATTVGILHPGSMGAAVAAQLRRTGVRVLWDPAGRGPATVRRAHRAGLEAAGGMAELVERCDTVISLCPPAAAEDVAREVARHGPAGKAYIEANAVSPDRVRRIAGVLSGTAVVDAAVIGSPPGGGKQPRLYASGPSDTVSALECLFAGTDVRFHPLGEELGRASALKLAYTAYQKASRVLAAVAYGAARANGVADELLDIAGQRPGSYLTEPDYIPKTAARAWRWAPELREAATLAAAAHLPDDLLHATAAVLTRWEDARDADLGIEEALDRLRDRDGIPVTRPR
jgi:3-hydroxyisobutyrate dehydrogenase-like beta-hydroxyacid dehydrogenase